MAVFKNIYLYFQKEFPEPDTWDFKFAYFFGIIYNQITGFDLNIYSNLELSHIQLLNPEYIDTNKVEFLIIIQNNMTGENSDKETIKKVEIPINGFPKNRIFHVIKKGNKDKIYQNLTSDFQQYNFFELNHRTLQIVDFNPDIPGDSESGFWEKLSDLAYDIRAVDSGFKIQEIKENTIYLAEVSDDQFKNREKLKRELKLLGYNVIPASPLPRDLQDFNMVVKESMENSIVSLHILGEMYGDTPPLDDYSYVEIQNRIFEQEVNIRKKSQNGFKTQRILWTPPVMNISDEKQLQYIKRIQNGTFTDLNTDYVQSTVSDLVQIVEKTISKIKSDTFEFIHEDQVPSVCIIFDKLDNELKQLMVSKFEMVNLPFHIIDLQETYCNSINKMLHEFKSKHFFILINTMRGNMWLKSIMGLIIKSKGLETSLPLSSIYILTTDMEKQQGLFPSLDIQVFPFLAYGFEDQINDILTKLAK